MASPNKTEQTDNLTGSMISLITNAQVRYEGTLIEINRAERSMNLQNVRSFGTEGRRDGKNEIQAHENTIPSVVFKVDHVKDFQIIKRPDVEAEKPKEDLQEQDPAIISAQNQQQQQQSTSTDEKPAEKQSNNSYGGGYGGGSAYGSSGQQREKKPYQQRQGGPPNQQNKDSRQGFQKLQNQDRQPQTRELESWKGEEKDDPKMRMSGPPSHRGGRQDHSSGDQRGGRGGYNNRGGRQQREPNNNLKMGEVKETPNQALQAKLKDNFDFSQRTLEEQKAVNSEQQQTNNKASNNEDDDKDLNGDKEQNVDDDNEDDAGGFFDSFAKSGPETRGRGGGRGMRDRVNQKDSDTFGAQSSQGFRYQDSNRSRGRGNRGGRGDRGGRGRGENNGGWNRGETTGYRGDHGGYHRGDHGGYRGEGGYQGRGGGDRDSYQGRGGGYRGNNPRGGNNYYRGGGRGGGYPRSTGDPLADAKREEQYQQKQQQQQQARAD